MTFDFKNGEVLLFDKPLEWTSFGVVKRVRNLISRHVGQKKIKVGHAGTLDPLATGLLILCTGKKTKTIPDLQVISKEYIADIYFGATTPSYDRETEIDKAYPTGHLSVEKIKAVLQQFTGKQLQKPPDFSAKHIDGQRAYKRARAGKPVDLKAVEVEFFELELLDYQEPVAQVRVHCSKGTYIRSLAHDLGQALNSGAHLAALKRTKIGDFYLDQAYSLEEFEKILTTL